jgi:hypothetical protein
MAPPSEMARLKAECQRLGIPINAKDSAERLRHKLRQRRARPGQAAEDRAPAIAGGDSQAQLTDEQRRDRETARHAHIAQDAAEKKVKDAKDLLEQAEKRQKEAEALPESTDPQAAAKASQRAKCALVIIACKKHVEAAHRQRSTQLRKWYARTSRAADAPAAQSLVAPVAPARPTAGPARPTLVTKNSVLLLRQQQQRLLILRHASKCPHENEKCPVTPHCAGMKRLWKHIGECKEYQCQFPHCVASRYVISHYHRCKDQRCEVCGPVRKAIQRDHKKAKKLALARARPSVAISPPRAAPRAEPTAPAPPAPAPPAQAPPIAPPPPTSGDSAPAPRAEPAAAPEPPPPPPGGRICVGAVVEARPDAWGAAYSGAVGATKRYRGTVVGPGVEGDLPADCRRPTPGERVWLVRYNEDRKIWATPEGFLSFVAPPKTAPPPVRRREQRLRTGSWVEVYWGEGEWFLGRVAGQREGKLKIAYTDGETHYQVLQDEPFSGDGNPPAPADGEPEHFRFAQQPPPEEPPAARPRAPAPENPRAAPRPRAAPPPPPSLRAVVELANPIARAERVDVQDPRLLVDSVRAIENLVRRRDLEKLTCATKHRSKHRVDKNGKAVTIGLTCTTKSSKISKTDDGQHLIHLCNEVLEAMGVEEEYASGALSENAHWRPHTDKNNDHSKRSIIVTCGTRKRGGGLWIREDGEEKLLDTYYKPHYFDGRNKHWTENWAGGDRISLVFYTHKNCRNVADDDEESPAPKRRRR